jgi:hypothetical protein
MNDNTDSIKTLEKCIFLEEIRDDSEVEFPFVKALCNYDAFTFQVIDIAFAPDNCPNPIPSFESNC